MWIKPQITGHFRVQTIAGNIYHTESPDTCYNHGIMIIENYLAFSLGGDYTTILYKCKLFNLI